MRRPTGGFDVNPQNINRKGAPKQEWTWGGLFRAQLEKKGATGLTAKAEIAKIMVKKALKGDAKALKMMMDRMEGIPKQSHEIIGKIIQELELTDDQFEELIRRRAKSLNSKKGKSGEAD